MTRNPHRQRFVAICMRTTVLLLLNDAAMAQPVTTAKPKPLTRQLSAVSTAHVSMRQHAMHFHEADLNEDGVLSRAEFHSSLAASVRAKHRSSLYYPIVIR